jgi:hypothetical protein
LRGKIDSNLNLSEKQMSMKESKSSALLTVQNTLS